jgi:DNA-binding NarL/FixJ family response regulator
VIAVIRILLVDDHTSTREPMAFMLDQEDDITVVAQAGSLAEARAAIAGVGSTLDVAVLDLGLPDGSGEELIADVHAASPHTVAIVLTYFSDRQRLARAVQAGASGILHKSASIDDVIGAIRRVHAGEQLLTLDEVMEALRTVEGERHRDGPHERLTNRELEVLQALADGLSDREIAERIYVSTATVRTHVTNILGKLNATSRLQALVQAVRLGIVSIG